MKKNKIRVLVAPERFPPDYSGAGLRAQRMINRMSEKYLLDFYVICSSKNNDVYARNNNNVIRINTVGERGLLFPLYLLVAFFKVNYYLINFQNRIDVIHFFSFSWLNRVMMFSNILFYKKKTMLEVTLDGADDPLSLITKGVRNKVLKHFTGFLLKRINKFVVLSEYSRDSCLRFGIDKTKIWLRPNPVDERIFGSVDLNKKYELRKKLNLPNDKFILLNVGIIQPRKNQLFLIKALSKLKDEPVMLIIIGPLQSQFEKYYDLLDNYIRTEGLSDKVRFINHADNVNEFMVASDLFVFSSLSEGFPNTVSEALMSGLPVLMTEIEKNGINKYINKENGLTIKKIKEQERGSKEDRLVDEFALAISDIYIKKIRFDKSKIREMGLHNFSTKKIDAEYLRVYEECIHLHSDNSRKR